MKKEIRIIILIVLIVVNIVGYIIIENSIINYCNAFVAGFGCAALLKMARHD